MATEKTLLELAGLLEKDRLALQAKIAGDFITKWGAIASIPDGDDSSGRQKVRLATPEEVVARAYACAELFVTVGERKGFIKIAGPSTFPADRHGSGVE